MSNLVSFASMVMYGIGLVFMGITAALHVIYLMARRHGNGDRWDSCLFTYICLFTLAIAILFLGLGFLLAPETANLKLFGLM